MIEAESVGKAIALGCTVVSIVARARLAGFTAPAANAASIVAASSRSIPLARCARASESMNSDQSAADAAGNRNHRRTANTGSPASARIPARPIDCSCASGRSARPSAASACRDALASRSARPTASVDACRRAGSTAGRGIDRRRARPQGFAVASQITGNCRAESRFRHFTILESRQVSLVAQYATHFSGATTLAPIGTSPAMTVVATRPRRDTRPPGSARNRGCRRPAVATASPGPPWGRCVHASRRNLRRWPARQAPLHNNQGPRRKKPLQWHYFPPWPCPLPPY